MNSAVKAEITTFSVPDLRQVSLPFKVIKATASSTSRPLPA